MPISSTVHVANTRRHTNLLRTHRRLVAQTILMYLDLAGEALPIQRWPDENFRQLSRAPSLDFDQRVLLDDVRHLLLLLLALVNLLLHVS